MRIIWPFLLLTLVIPQAALGIPLNFLRDAPVAQFTEEDFALLQQTLQDALKEGEDGEVYSWQNPTTGAEGDIIPLSTYEEQGHRCRRVQLINRARKGHGMSIQVFCRDDTGTWKWAATTRPSKSPKPSSSAPPNANQASGHQPEQATPVPPKPQ
ncbi:MAG: RT0821/Lpp0805 family surface protein [Pseudomonadota bacterium]|nr:RT0821/Lpp0805 family surface protein [Pseudomonadota bacterium]